MSVFLFLSRLRLASSLSAAGAFLTLSAMAGSASATPNGLDGNTGKPISGLGYRCGDCHKGGTAPTVAFAGPASLNSGQTGSYTLTVNTNSTRVGGAVAVTPDSTDSPSAGVTLIPGGNMKSVFNEVVHGGTGVASSAGKVTFTFSFVAPPVGGTVKLWGVGLATNNQGNTTGDADALTTMNVTVVGPTPVDAGTKDSGFVPSDSGTKSDGGTVPGSDGGTVPGKDGGNVSADGSTDEGEDTLPASGESSCAVSAVGASSVDGGALGAAFFTMIGLVAGQRRAAARRRRAPGRKSRQN